MPKVIVYHCHYKYIVVEEGQPKEESKCTAMAYYVDMLGSCRLWLPSTKSGTSQVLPELPSSSKLQL